jgi:DNA modification methylase
MQIQTVDIDIVIPYAKNPRKNEAAVDKVAASLKEFGFRQPIVVDAEMVVIAGHTRLAASRKLGLKQVPIHVATDLTANQIKAYRIADNRVSQEAKWDEDMLALELADLDLENYDLGLTGFDDDELAALMAEAVTEGLVDEDQVPAEPETPVTVLGDIWQLGRHRVMCGDSTSIDAVDELMESQHPDMVFTDPPYNIDYQGVKDKRDKIKNDKMPDADFVDFLTASLLSCETMYVCCSWQYAHLFKDAMEKIARKPKAMIVWDKVNPAQNLDKYYKQHELIFYYGDFGGHKTLRGDVWKLKRQKNTMHPTMKPVELIEIALQDNVGKNLIYDAFGGSGSTLIACEKTNRQARLMELDPKYVDVIVKRWQDFTGLIAVNEKTGKTFNEMNNVSDHVPA